MHAAQTYSPLPVCDEEIPGEIAYSSESLLHPRSNRFEVCIHFTCERQRSARLTSSQLSHETGFSEAKEARLTWRRSKNERDNSIPGDLDVLHGSKDMYMSAESEQSTTRQCQHYAIDGQITHVSARTILVRLAFSIENFTLPPSPAIRPDHRVI